jgi:DnaJ family protein C protein 3
LHKLLRTLDKETTKARNFVDGGSFRPAIKILEGPDGLLAKFDKILEEGSLPSAIDGIVYLPAQFNGKAKSASRLGLYAMACKAAVGVGDLRAEKGGKWCDVVYTMDNENVDGLVGRGEGLLKEEKWEEAVRVFEKAFENGGRSSQDVRHHSILPGETQADLMIRC